VAASVENASPSSVAAKCEQQGSTSDEPVILVFRHLEREWQLPLRSLPLKRGRQVRTAGFEQ